MIYDFTAIHPGEKVRGKCPNTSVDNVGTWLMPFSYTLTFD